MKKLLLFLIFSNLIFANNFDLINNFLKGKNYEKEIDKLTTNESFINALIKSKNLKYGFYENPSTLILCIKSKKEITILDVDTNISTKMNFSILTGENSGDKWLEGDGKTPIGSYRLQYFLKDNQIDDYYGPLAYPTNYPNNYDKYLGKNGHGIWIHGLPKDKNIEKFDTKGCIALKNGDLIKFHNLIDYKNSILFIDENELPTTNKEEITIILKSLMEWRYAWKYNNINTYLSFYNKTEFKKENRYGFSFFKSLKEKIFKRKESKQIKIENLKIIPYPNSQNKRIFKVCFKETYKSSRFNFEGRKELYVTIENNKMSIILEN
jgi:murein L,D-transpeptidase YafK